MTRTARRSQPSGLAPEVGWKAERSGSCGSAGVIAEEGAVVSGVLVRERRVDEGESVVVVMLRSPWKRG